MCEKMVMREKNAPEQLDIVPSRAEREAVVPIATRQVDYSAYTIEKLRESVTAMELDHHNFPTPFEASAHTHAAEKWERLPINKNHSSSRHDPVGKLFENLRQSVADL
jgi:hypothetical protein